MHAIAAHSVEYSPEEFLMHARKRLSVTLQSSNADIAQLAMQQYHLRQHAANTGSFDHHERERDARHRIYSQPADGDRLARKVSLVVQAAELQAFQREAAAARTASAASASSHSDSSDLPFVHERRVGFADVVVQQPRTVRTVVEVC